MDQRNEQDSRPDILSSVYIKQELKSHSEESKIGLQHIVKLEEFPIDDSVMKVEYAHCEGYSDRATNLTYVKPKIPERLTEVWIKDELNYDRDASNIPSPRFIVANDICEVNSPLHPCTLCDMKFTKLHFLAKHFQVHSRSMHVCIVCNDKLVELESQSKTDSCEMSKASFICHDCSNRLLYYCVICGKGFAKSVDLEQHAMRNHAKPYECRSCDMKFSSSNQLNVHVRNHGSGKGGKRAYSCDLCYKSFKSPSHLKSHTSTHTGEKPFACDLCDNSFTQLTHLKTHIRIHTGVKPFSCEFCDKSYRILSSLNTHIRIHTGVKMHACDFCDKSFTNSSKLKLHSRTHTNEKPYPCHFCDKRYTRPIGLNRHIRTHMDEKPSACDLCDTKFTYPFQLKAHLKTHEK